MGSTKVLKKKFKKIIDSKKILNTHINNNNNIHIYLVISLILSTHILPTVQI